MELQLKDYPKNLKKRIKANVKAEELSWEDCKNISLVGNAFVWSKSTEGFDFWDAIDQVDRIEDLNAISKQLK